MRPAEARITALALVLLAVAPCGCVSSKGVGSSSHTGTPDSSFAAVTFQRHRSPLDLSVARGQVVYARYCSICHGDAGEGDGFNAYNVKATFGVSPAALTDSTVFATLREDTVLAAIRGGGPAVGKSAAMPPWGRTLTPGEVIDVWHYIRSLARAAHAEHAQ